MTNLGKIVINQGKILQIWFEIDQLRVPALIYPAENIQGVEDDKEFTRRFNDVDGNLLTLVPQVAYSLNNNAVSFEYSSDNPTEIGVNPDGSVHFLVSQLDASIKLAESEFASPRGTWDATITIIGTNGEHTTTRTVLITLTVTGNKMVDVIDGGVAGSARKALSDPIDTALIGANPVTQQRIYTSQDHVTPAYVRNTNFFLQGTHAGALTCASPWNSTGGAQRAGTAITPRHAVCANHYPISVGATIRFIATDNTVITRTVVQAARIFNGEGQGTDAWMILLDSDLPASITPCKIFPNDYNLYFPNGTGFYPMGYYVDNSEYVPNERSRLFGLPLLALDQEEKGIVTDLREQNGTGATIQVPILADRFAFNETIISGDSGNPIFAVIGSELWLLSTFFSPGSGPFYGGLVTELNAMITTLDTLQGDITGHTVTVGDLSSYTAY